MKLKIKKNTYEAGIDTLKQILSDKKIDRNAGFDKSYMKVKNQLE